MKTEKLLGIMIVMQGLILAGQWAGPVGSPSVAHAEPFNPSERQLAILDEAKQTNSKLDKLMALLQSGEVTVKVAKEDAK
ncbi:MAG TPA: hypothetical protein VFC78_15940 [Tepidisphaeraceae bacterium]|nr:hypothetical protein [Tepidisphaeraceae bacterium]